MVSQLLCLQPKWPLLSRTALFRRRSGLVLLEGKFSVSEKNRDENKANGFLNFKSEFAGYTTSGYTTSTEQISVFLA